MYVPNFICRTFYLLRDYATAEEIFPQIFKSLHPTYIPGGKRGLSNIKDSAFHCKTYKGFVEFTLFHLPN
ncbi:hypothetical protein L6452_32242 [Arctium lappa]|uniref:Uncharacterized protein n=1 Tax=Arctium lappa TaxID=4217 RepID=A0ACB8Z4E9_ARCLA|nr:hypothetical protein L6452_32242 [Arctium lappa]